MLRLHVRYLDDYATSLRALYNLRVHLQKATVVYDQSVDDKTVGAPCQVSFGSLPEASDSAEGEPHPIEAVRSFFHFPEQELFLNVQIPPAQRAWSHVSLCLDLGPDWPRSPAPSPDLFQLGVVPVINLRRDSAQPITLDGTQDAYPIRYPLPGRALKIVAGEVWLRGRGGLSAVPAGVSLSLSTVAEGPPVTAVMYEQEAELAHPSAGFFHKHSHRFYD